MAIKAAGSPQPPISFSDIENEFGNNATRSLGAYRMNNLSIGDLSEVSLSRDGCGLNANSSIPVDNQTIKFSDFYSAKQNIYLNLYTSNQNRINAKNDKFNASNPSGNYVVVGGTNGTNGPKPSDTNGKKVIIHVTKLIGSAKGSQNNCALRTGSWNFGTEVLVEVGSGGKIIGAGGNGGDGVEDGTGGNGESGTGALGIDHSGTKIQTSGGSIVCGFGGGGAGGGGETKREGNWRGSGRGPEVKAGGGGGGGGMGVPAGSGGLGAEGSSHNGTAGSATAAGNGGEGAENTSRGEATINGGTGGEGGFQGNTEDGIADQGQSGFLSGGEHEDAETHSGGLGGANGGAIRKASGSISFTLVGSPTIIGTTNETGVS